ncbi:restriction endonuclease subunit S [Aeromonas veronii]|uniref:restriction endonuclease subunit S n=1 Tax=Aeromonas veronii TaxID=654 RepID=UPI001E4FFC4A|nr:restriction endonuclease subunit S [Aeromonas veronii]MCD6615909.1 restriction endonuclease subunit S [Aeromonas veronii]
MSVEKNVPEIRFKGFSGEWGERRLGSLCLIGDIDHRMPESKTTGIPYLMTGDFYGINGLDFSRAKLISIEDYEQLSKKIKPEFGDILFARYASVGAVRYVETDTKFLISYSCAILKTNNTTYGKYLFYFFQTERTQGQLELDINTGSQRNIGIDSLKSLLVVLPKPAEQAAIGTTFQKLDNLINQHQQKHDKLSNIKKAMLEKMFPKPGKTIPEVRFKGFSGEWEEKELGTDIADIIGGGTPSTSISKFWNGDIDWYSPTEIGSNVYAEGSQKKITTLGLNSSSAKILPAGNTVLFTSRAGIGDMAILTKPGSTNQGFQSFVVKEGFSPYFIYSAGKKIKEYALKHASGSTFLEISGKQLGLMKMLVPCETEQTAIGNYFQKLDMLINQHQQQITKLNNIKQACLSKMFV